MGLRSQLGQDYSGGQSLPPGLRKGHPPAPTPSQGGRSHGATATPPVAWRQGQGLGHKGGDPTGSGVEGGSV